MGSWSRIFQFKMHTTKTSPISNKTMFSVSEQHKSNSAYRKFMYSEFYSFEIRHESRGFSRNIDGPLILVSNIELKCW